MALPSQAAGTDPQRRGRMPPNKSAKIDNDLIEIKHIHSRERKRARARTHAHTDTHTHTHTNAQAGRHARA
ncbi:hypothetical protein EVAR_11100_1 [Eumeta japonica]|uniref:Uncharacterized protein n=1 Tax=Eumeta variegata TaxID=151549 RepID=A0A4C1U450_EUMVA|nr:hypothetical protein EVAR_11100_1 [Eumeta japonica]